MTADAILTKRRRRGEAARRMHSEMELWATPSLLTSADRNNNSSSLGTRPKYFSYNNFIFPLCPNFILIDRRTTSTPRRPHPPHPTVSYEVK